MRCDLEQRSGTRGTWRLRHGLIFLVLVAGLQGLPGSAQEARDAEAQDSEQITQLEVVGNQKQAPETVLFRAGIKVGDDLRTLDLTEVLDRLWATGAYDDIKFDVSDAPGGKKLTIRVKERPLIKEVDYRGGTQMGVTGIKDKIKERKLTISPDSTYDPEATRKIKDLLVDLAEEKGYTNPVVEVSMEPMGPTMARLVFDIKEGGRVKVYKVTFRGNKVLGSARLRKAMAKTRAHGWGTVLNGKDLLVDANLNQDLENLRKEYWKLGYKDVFVGKPTVTVEDFTTEKMKKANTKRAIQGKSPKYDLRASLDIPILEGDQYMAGTFKVEGNDKVFKGAKGDAFYRDKVNEVQREHRSLLGRLFNQKTGMDDKPGGRPRPFDLTALNEGLDKVREAYSNQGYVQFRADKQLTVREEGGVKKVDVLLKVDEGEQYTVRKIAIEGNTKTKDKVIRRSMILREGDVFRVDQYKDSFTGIGQLGYFDVKGVEPRVDFVPDKPQVDVTIRGQESGVNELMFQGGYGSVFGFSLGASYSTKNLGGGGESLTFSYTIGQYQKNESITYTEPYLLDMPYSVSTTIANGSVKYDASRVGNAYSYQQKSRSLGVSMGTRLSTFLPDRTWAFFTTYSVGYRFSIMQVIGGHSYYFRNTDPQLTSTLSQSLSYNTVNHPFKPTAGQKISVSFEYGGWQFGTDAPFYRTNLEYEKIHSLGERHILALNTSYGYMRNLSGTNLPLWDLYRPGGENSIRGYRFGQVGSVQQDNNLQEVVVGGNKQFIFNFEYQFKVADLFRTVVFYDMGQAWGQGSPVFSDGLKKSAGVELRFFLPISPAPLRLIWARKLNPYPFDTTAQNDFQFSIGTTF